MERRDFYDLAEANVRHYMPREYQDVQFELVETRKMNDVKATGLKARVPGWNMEPIVYLDGYYDQYERSLDATSAVISLANDMLATMKRAKANDFAIIEKPSQGIYEHIRDRLEIKLCDVDNNERFLAGRPHTVIGDFAATYAFSLEEREASGLIMNGFLEDEGISVERLHADALAAEASRGIALYYMSDIMDNLLAGDEPRNILASGKLPEDMPESPVEMYVLTNGRRHFGASAILQRDALRRVGEILGGDYVVLPSSVHEVIIVPAEEMEVTPQECRAMVREINDTTVRPEERLSDKVQYYDVANERLVGYEEHERELERTRQIQADGKDVGMTSEKRGEKENGRNPEPGRNGKVPNGKSRHAPTASAPRL